MMTVTEQEHQLPLYVNVGLERETVDHFLLRCNKYDEARNILMDSIKHIWITSKIKASCTVNENLLLSPPHADSHITHKAQKKINGALFEFLASVDRRL